MLATLDYIVIISFLVLIVGIGLSFRKKAGKNLTSFFLGGRNLPWYIAGISMVATTFAADTPLAVTELVGQNGISGNWLWWNFLAGGMLTTFFFANLWRRSGVLTEVELIELRYHGKAAAFLRGFKAIYLGLFMNVIIIGWVNVALISLLQGFFDISYNQALMFCGIGMVLVAIYSSISGLLGVAITDVIQFIIAMTGCIILAVLVVNSEKIGGIDGLIAQTPDSARNFFPQIGTNTNAASNLALGFGAFFAYAGMVWWATWYPGAEPGGGGYVAQRMMSAKTEKDSVYATLFFQIAHYCIRPWPWILVGLSALVLYPELGEADKKMGFVYAMRDYLPTGLKGLLLVAFFAAYMSTISTQLNWGASYLVNDVYKRFLKPESTDERQVMVARITTILLMVVGLFVSTLIETISGVWSFIIECGAGLGMVLILRWYWWRINAWSEIAATITPFFAYALSKWVFAMDFPTSFFFTVGITTFVWLAVTYVTPPTNIEHLKRFYLKITPEGLWEPIKSLTSKNNEKSQIFNLIICWLSAVIMTYSILFFTGKIIFKEWSMAGIWFGVGIVSFLILKIFLSKTKILK